MIRQILLPPQTQRLADGSVAGGWWHDAPGDEPRIICDLCPRACNLKPGDRGFCFVRENRDGQMVLTTYGRSTGFCIDPVEKKPLNHFYPGTSVLSFGTAGCNLGCKFCQNWDISKSREIERLSEQAEPPQIARAASRLGCRSVAMTYNDPVIWAEYAMATAQACRERGIHTIAVTAGYITPQAREPFFRHMDAANVDLKGFTEDFYHRITYSHLQPVLDTLVWLKNHTDVWFEITNLVIPQANDDPDDLRRMCAWIQQAVGDQTPVHFTAFHPDFRMTDRPRTPVETLLKAYEIARQEGLKFVYVGNVDDVHHQSTYCPGCGQMLIERNWYELGAYQLDQNRCRNCGERIAGRFDLQPGTWGRKRQPVRIGEYSRPATSGIQPSSVGAAPASAGELPGVSGDLDQQQRTAICRAACTWIAAGLRGERGEKRPDGKQLLGDLSRRPVSGAFVTLKRKGRLRACCGALGSLMPLENALEQAARRTATADHRFPPISPVELPYLTVAVTLLSEFQTVAAAGRERAAAIQIGRHGLRIQRGTASGLLLPSVAVEHGLDCEAFLRQVCRKAGLPTLAWTEPDVVLQTFEGSAMEGAWTDFHIPENTQPYTPLPDAGALGQLARFCHENLVALLRGATPSYVGVGLPDGEVHGLVVRVTTEPDEQVAHFSRIGLRPGFALQSTLFQLTESAAQWLLERQSRGTFRVGLSVLTDPAMHGTSSDADLRGLDANSRAILLLCDGHFVLAWDATRSSDQLFQTAIEKIRRLPGEAGVFSMEVRSTDHHGLSQNLPRPRPGTPTRPPAVAGSFYPHDPRELAALVQGLLADAADGPKQRVPAALIPHAGLAYSGSIAARVLAQLEIPRDVIVLGPKHTRDGMPWAVAPPTTWQIPGASLEGNLGLAELLAGSIEGWTCDAAAHAREHAVEMALPFLAQLAPSSRIVGVVLQSTPWARCEQFARQLAGVIAQLDPPPLLLISSDMNHFATDAQTRQLDELALTALEACDPKRALATIREHQISMCGVVPAVIVMEALRQLNRLKRIERVAYATSADVTGDVSRVVGYAGLLLNDS